ncbi:MAG: heme exporter protein CcmB [Bacteroidota bacterium]
MRRFWAEFKALWLKEIKLEWKQRYAFFGLLLYVGSTVLVVGLAFQRQMNPLSWNILFWIILLFVAINAVAKSFMTESATQQQYLYSLSGPSAIILTKIFYNTGLLGLIGTLGFIFFSLIGGVKIIQMDLFTLIVWVVAWTLAATLTLVSAIAAKAENRVTLLAVLGFPLTVPVLLTAIRISRVAIEGLEATTTFSNIYFLLGLAMLLTAISMLLFPTLWKE